MSLGLTTGILPSRNESNALRFLWIEVTRKCNLACLHCYTDSSPSAPDSSMRLADWAEVLTAAKGLGVQTVQFIGGEPTLSSELVPLIELASQCQLSIEVYSNLYRVSNAQWDCFTRNRVALATSVHSANSDEHDRITTRSGSLDRTLSNIQKARSLGLTVRAGAVKVVERQDVLGTRNLLANYGVGSVRIDSVRKVGRPAATSMDQQSSMTQLCGACTSGVAAISSDGDVLPCVMARDFKSGNVREEHLGDIVNGKLKNYRHRLDEFFKKREVERHNGTGRCSPSCDPVYCPPTCPPMTQDCPPVQSYCPPNDPSLCPPTEYCQPQSPWPPGR